jgi:outer membrane protein OmpA-like peptidoglycan-associated protein
MVDLSAIREHMDVVDADGRPVGRVDAVAGGRIKLTRADAPGGEHRYIEFADVEHVDSRVHLSRGSGAAPGKPGAATHAVAATRRTNWLPWVLAALALIALLAALSQCQDRNSADAGTDPEPARTVAGDRSGAAFTAGTMAYEVDRYLTSGGAAPRTFAFERVNFDSGRATIRDEDQSDIADIARVLVANPQVRAAVVGYTDAEGPAASNAALGAERARSVVAALVRRGADPSRLEARSGGEANPEASNTDQGGRFQNRRTELIILGR